MTNEIETAEGRSGGGSMEPAYTAQEVGERTALLQVRSFVIKNGHAEVDAFCAQRLHDIAMDARHRGSTTVLHAYKPHAQYPWFCADCGYAEHERLQHPPRTPSPESVA